MDSSSGEPSPRSSPTIGPETATRIVEVASTLFFERGFRGVGMRMIAEEVGIRPASLYHYFPSKVDLLDAIVSDVTAAFIDGHRHDFDGGAPFCPALRSLLSAHIVYFWDHRVAEAVGLAELRELPSERIEEVRLLRRSYQELITYAIRSGVGTGEFHVADPSLASLGLLGMINGVNVWFNENGRFGIEEVADAFSNLICDHLLMGSPTNY